MKEKKNIITEKAIREALSKMPKTVKKKARAAKEKARIQKNFLSVLDQIFQK